MQTNLLYEQWTAFSKNLPSEIGLAEKIWMKRAFYIGASIVGVLLPEIAQPNMPMENKLMILTTIGNELKRFEEKVGTFEEQKEESFLVLPQGVSLQ